MFKKTGLAALLLLLAILVTACGDKEGPGTETTPGGATQEQTNAQGETLDLIEGVLEEIHPGMAGKLAVSIAAGWDVPRLREALPQDARIVRVMPNTPLMAGAGMSLLDAQHTATEEEYAFVRSVFACAGEVCEVEPRIFDAASGISGCGPAFVYPFIEALADGGVRNGVPRTLAYRLAAQTVIGAGRMVLDTGEHPGALKDAVCSPGGTTIEGVAVLERRGLRAAVIDAVTATVEKTERLKQS